MNMLQIAARISAIFVESKIRHKPENVSEKFNLNKFKSLSGNELYKYADGKLQQTGEGSSRAVFILNSSKVLKIAITRKNSLGSGAAQNKTEVDFYTNPKTKQVCAKIFDFDPDYEWLISELVRPVSEEEFEKLTGVNSYDFGYFGKNLIDGLSPEEIYEHYSEDNIIHDTKPISKKLFDKWIYVLENIVNQGIMTEDLTNPGHWGVTSSGNLVVLDYGLTDSVWTEHYNNWI